MNESEARMVASIVENFGIDGEINDNSLYRRIEGWGDPDADPDDVIDRAVKAGVLKKDGVTYSLKKREKPQ